MRKINYCLWDKVRYSFKDNPLKVSLKKQVSYKAALFALVYSNKFNSS